MHSDSPCRGYQQQTYYLPIENGAKDFSCRSLRFEASSSRNFACSDSKPFRISSGFLVLLPLRRGQLPLHGVRRDRIAVSGRSSTRFSTSRVFASRLCQGDFLSVNLWLLVPSSLSPGCGTQLNRLIRRAQARGSQRGSPADPRGEGRGEDPADRGAQQPNGEHDADSTGAKAAPPDPLPTWRSLPGQDERFSP